MGKRLLRFSDGSLLQLLGDGAEFHFRVAGGLPPDAKIVDVQMEGRWRAGRGVAAFLLESPRWEPTPEGEPCPEIEPVLTSLYPRPGDYLTFEESLRCPNHEAPA